MTHTLILIITIALCFALAHKLDEDSLGNVFSISVGVVAIILFLIHLVCIGLVNHNYNSFKYEREVIEQMLTHTRQVGNQDETSEIVEQALLWNMELKQLQYQNSTWFFDPYLSDDLDNLTPIQ